MFHVKHRLLSRLPVHPPAPPEVPWHGASFPNDRLRPHRRLTSELALLSRYPLAAKPLPEQGDLSAHTRVCQAATPPAPPVAGPSPTLRAPPPRQRWAVWPHPGAPVAPGPSHHVAEPLAGRLSALLGVPLLEATSRGVKRTTAALSGGVFHVKQRKPAAPQRSRCPSVGTAPNLARLSTHHRLSGKATILPLHLHGRLRQRLSHRQSRYPFRTTPLGQCRALDSHQPARATCCGRCDSATSSRSPAPCRPATE